MALLSERLNQVNRQSIAAAGPRYSPAVEAGAPNLRISSLIKAIESLSQSPQYKQELSRLDSSIRDAWREAPEQTQRLFYRLARTPMQRICFVSSFEPASGHRRAGRRDGRIRLSGRYLRHDDRGAGGDRHRADRLPNQHRGHRAGGVRRGPLHCRFSYPAENSDS